MAEIKKVRERGLSSDLPTADGTRLLQPPSTGTAQHVVMLEDGGALAGESITDRSSARLPNVWGAASTNGSAGIDTAEPRPLLKVESFSSDDSGPNRECSDGFVGQQGLARGGHSEREGNSSDNLGHKELLCMTKRKMRMLLFIVVTIVYFALAIGYYCGSLDWSVVDAVYFAIVAMTTVGYGDHPPIETSEAKIFTAFFVLYGVSIISVVVTHFMNSAMRAKNELVAKMKAKRMQKMVQDPLAPDQTDADVSESNHVLSYIGLATFVFIVYGSGVLAMMDLEDDRDFAETLYFIVATATTVGFGDISFETDEGKIFSCFWIVLVTSVTVSSLAKLGSYIVGNDDMDDVLDDELDDEFFKELDDFGNSDGTVDMFEWMSFVLDKAGYVDKKTLARIRGRFDQLDIDKSGTLTTKDFRAPFLAASETRQVSGDPSIPSKAKRNQVVPV